jgi:amino acid transporter
MTGMDYVRFPRHPFPLDTDPRSLIFSQLIAGSRQLFAFSRDHGLPFSRIIYKVNPHTKTPVNAVFFLAIMSLLLGLISFAGPIAISAVFTMSVVCQYIGFVTPIIARWIGGTKFEPGPFNLGRLVSLALYDTLS